MSSIRFTLGEKFRVAMSFATIVTAVLGIIGWIMNIAAIIPLLDGGFTPWLLSLIHI